MPRFKKKGVKDTFVFPQGFSVEGNRVKLPKLGWIKFRKSRDLEGKMKSATVSRNGKHWFVSILCEIEVAKPIVFLNRSSNAIMLKMQISMLQRIF